MSDTKSLFNNLGRTVVGKTTPFSEMARPNKPKSERLTDPVTLAMGNGWRSPTANMQDALYPDRVPTDAGIVAVVSVKSSRKK